MSLFYAIQVPTPESIAKSGEVLAALPFYVIMVLILGAFMVIGYVIWKGTQKTQADISAITSKLVDKGSESTDSLASALATLANIMQNQHTQNLERDKASAKRDEAIALIGQGLKDQNELLKSGNELSRKLTETFSDSVSDTSTAVGAVGESLGAQMTEMEKKLVEIIDKLPAVFAEKTMNSHSAMKQSVVELSKDITRVFAPVIAENNKLREEGKFLQDSITERDLQIKDLVKKLEDCPPPADIHIVTEVVPPADLEAAA